MNRTSEIIRTALALSLLGSRFVSQKKTHVLVESGELCYATKDENTISVDKGGDFEARFLLDGVHDLNLQEKNSYRESRELPLQSNSTLVPNRKGTKRHTYFTAEGSHVCI